MTSFDKLNTIAGRLLAALCLYIGLELAARLLGAGGGQSPLLKYGHTAFTYLAIFAVGYIFAAIGIWIGSKWGCVVAIGIALAELTLAMFGGSTIRLPMFDFLLALLVLVAAIGLCLFARIRTFLSVHD